MIKKYTCDLYPFCLWVGTAEDTKGVNKKFEFYNSVKDINDFDAKPLEIFEDVCGYAGLAYLVVEKDSKFKGVLIFINRKYLKRKNIEKGEVYNVIAHESKHAADVVSEMNGLAEAPTWDNNEHQAFLIGWIAGKIGEYWESVKNKK